MTRKSAITPADNNRARLAAKHNEYFVKSGRTPPCECLTCSGRGRLSDLAGIGEKLAEGKWVTDRAFAEQIYLLFVEITETDQSERILILASIGLELTFPRIEDDDLFGDYANQLFEMIADEADALMKRSHAQAA